MSRTRVMHGGNARLYPDTSTPQTRASYLAAVRQHAARLAETTIPGERTRWLRLIETMKAWRSPDKPDKPDIRPEMSGPNWIGKPDGQDISLRECPECPVRSGATASRRPRADPR